MTPLNPTTSLSMIYLREFARWSVSQRGMVRAGRKAMHMLRMHWSACATRLADGSEIAADGLDHQNSTHSVSVIPKRLEGAFQGGHA